VSRVHFSPEESFVPSPSGLVPVRPERFLSVTPRARDPRHVVLDVSGDVDAFTAPVLRACLRTQLSRPGLHGMVLDVGQVGFLGAAGVSVLVEAARRCRERGIGFRLRAPGGGHVLPSLLTRLGVELDDAAVPPLARSVTHA
jgi:anti-anti-sigma factor